MITTSDKLRIIQDNQKSCPVMTTPIAKALGLKVFHTDWIEDDGKTSNISGMIKKDDRAGHSGYSIYVNKAHHLNRQRFTIAHEIAHYVLHQDMIGDAIVDDALYRSGLINKVEIEANNFAADILMPWHLIDEAMKSTSDIEELAKMFKVSSSAMAIRLRVPFES